MPYYLIPKRYADDPFVDMEPWRKDNLRYRAQWLEDLGYRSFPSRGEAFQNLVKDDDGKHTEVILFCPFWTESNEAERRISDRFQLGKYFPVPFIHEIDGDLRLHHVHIPADNPALVGYFPDLESLIADRVTRTTCGRYLQRFYGEIMSDRCIAQHVDQCKAIESGSYNLATSESDVVAVYMNGPRSCMSGDHFGPNGDGEIISRVHPAAVYASPSDLAVAYVGELSSPSQRSVIWPERKTYARVYGTGPLEILLKRDGYHCESPYGARIRRISATSRRSGISGYLMPYVDGCSYASEDGDRRFLILADDGDINAQCTSGIAGYRDDDQEQEPETHACEHCDRQIDIDESLCNRCENRQYYCNHCEEYKFDDDTTPHDVDGETWCDTCYDAEKRECADANCTNEWIDCDVFTDDDIADRKRHHVDDLCPSCAERYVYCEHCDRSYDTDDPLWDTNVAETDYTSGTCPTCGRYPRCTEALDLLTPVRYHLLKFEPLVGYFDRVVQCAFCDDDSRRQYNPPMAIADDPNDARLIGSHAYLSGTYPNYTYRIVDSCTADRLLRSRVPPESVFPEIGSSNESPF